MSDNLFTMKIDLYPFNDKVLMTHPKVLKLCPDGTAKCGRKKAGTVRKEIWNYITQFGTPTEARELDPEVLNMFKVTVPGEINMELLSPDVDGKMYSYHCGSIPFPEMIPNNEYKCELVDQEDHFDIIVAGKKIGKVDQAKDRDRLGILRRMIKQDFKFTAQIQPTLTKCNLYLILREV